MQVYNVLGQRVETLVDARTSAGLHTVTWDGTNRYGERVGSGVYFVRMEAGSTTETQKVVLVR
jgi:flagellar hook assembly protein FlgD